MKSISDLIYNELIWHKLNLIKIENRVIAEIALRWEHSRARIPGALSRLPHIRKIASAAAHFAYAEMLPILKDFAHSSESAISTEMQAAYRAMAEDFYASWKSADKFAFELIPWAHVPMETEIELSRTKILDSELRQWPNTYIKKQLSGIKTQLQIGLLAGEGVEQLAKRLSDEFAYGRVSANAMARTMIHGAANRALDNIYRANKDILKGVMFTSTLDVRTCEICGGYDGRVFSVDDYTRPAVPVHINCRCVYTPVMKSADELGLGPAELPATTRASMNGAVPESLRYGEWFDRLSDKRQMEILGKKKYLLWKRGEYKLKWEGLEIDS